MTAIGASGWDVIMDGLKVMGLSTVLCFVYHLFRLLFPIKNKIIMCVLHVPLFALFAFIVFCFILGETVSRQPRWTMAAGAALAVLAYFLALAPPVEAAFHALRAAVGFLLRPVKKIARFVKNIAIRLQKRYYVLYNQHRKKYTSRINKRRKTDDAEHKNGTKEPIKVYTQT
jgi:hypothetical protein